MEGKCITITFGEVAENHVGMQKIGKLAENGFNLNELSQAKEIFEAKGYQCELITLEHKLSKDKGYVLIVRNGVQCLLSDAKNNDLMKELSELKWDTKAKMKGRVVNKIARHNLCFDKKYQAPDYENGKGTIIAWKNVKLLKQIKKKLHLFFGQKAKKLKAEGNLYYNTKKCGIGYHGDSERKIVIALRLGESMPLHYTWFMRSKPISEPIELNINGGDIYAMSEKATGFDWLKTRKNPTLRHAAGAKKYLQIKQKK